MNATETENEECFTNKHIENLASQEVEVDINNFHYCKLLENFIRKISKNQKYRKLILFLQIVKKKFQKNNYLLLVTHYYRSIT